MTAWPAREELRQLGLADGLAGLAMLVAALVLGAEPMWLALGAGVALLGALYRVRWTVRRFTDAPPPAGTVMATGTQILLRRVPMRLGDTLTGAVIGVILAVIGIPVFLGLFGVLSLSMAACRLAVDVRVARWERDHGGRVLRTGGFLKEDHYYLAV
jgi:hypothetical protein